MGRTDHPGRPGAETAAGRRGRTRRSRRSSPFAAAHLDWKWPGAVGLREGAAVHVVDGWRYLGSATDEAMLADILAAGRPAFDLDVYRIQVKAVQRLPVMRL